jgi:chorismate mutase / prephenate dehydrogenase
MSLESLREQLNLLDRQLLELVARRQALGAEIAKVKRAAGQPTRDYQREREVLLQARDHATRLGLSPALAETLLRPLIHSSLATQEQARVVAQGHGSGKRALIIGGRGQMGRWFASFLNSQGFAVEVADPAGGLEGYPSVADWRGSALDHDLIVVATPLGLTSSTLEQLAQRRPPGLIFDLGSLKTPLRHGLDALALAGCQVASIHPMFGPETELLSGRHVIFINLGLPEPLAAARELFSQTMVEQVVMTLDEHDRLIAFVLGLSHALNIAFVTALAESGEMAPTLARLSSTTFDAQMDVARWVIVSNPVLYYEIQRLNEYGGDALKALKTSVGRLCDVVAHGDESAFVKLMERGREYLEQRTLDVRNIARQHT